MFKMAFDGYISPENCKGTDSKSLNIFLSDYLSLYHGN